ncbi:MAG: hypothetical protein PHG60_00205 [Candidatus Dojkabacteria bacterium]|jgi:hypothetical protein|nr:hypothetical protein [Candidatus Dojkabacteria bacterium]MDD2270003.1 hypothetical protein [Candidatus Dojkabacteria bacterium]
MYDILKSILLGLLAIGLVIVLVFGVIFGVAIIRNLNNPETVDIQEPPVESNPVNTTVIENPISAPNSDCVKQAEQIGAPKDVISAICEATPGENGVSMRLPVGTVVQIGTITFDAENRVWFLQDFVVPSMASYAFEYAGNERAIFDAPFVVGSELGWAKDGSRVPFEICFDTKGECTPPTSLFP